MIHTLLITAHATCAVAAFVLGLLVAWQPPDRPTPVFRTYLVTLWLMVLFLLAVVVVDWADIETVKRSIYSGLLVLVAYTAWRGWQAAKDLEHPGPDAQNAFVEDLGFTLIALFDGFVIVSAIDLGAPIWLVVAIGVLGVVVGRLGILRLKARASSPTAALAR